MPQPAEPHAVLLSFDRWANTQMYDACEPLSEQQFHRPFEMGTGSLHNNLLHNLGAMRRWGDALTGGPMRPRLEQEGRCTLSQIRAHHETIADEFAAAALARPFDTIVTREFNAKTYTFTAGGILAHVMTHSMHHRAQCLNMLRQLGVEPLPMSSVMEWMLTT